MLRLMTRGVLSSARIVAGLILGRALIEVEDLGFTVAMRRRPTKEWEEGVRLWVGFWMVGVVKRVDEAIGLALGLDN